MNTHRKDGTWVPDAKTRRWLYGIATALVPLLVALGVFTEAHGGLWLAVVAAVLAPGATALAAANTDRETD